jgi:membrane-associated phospholipid phosphatase
MDQVADRASGPGQDRSLEAPFRAQGSQVAVRQNEFPRTVSQPTRALPAISLRATATLTLGIYLSALGASALLGVAAPILSGVPLCLAVAFGLSWCNRITFPNGTRTALFVEAACAVIVLGLSLACLSYLAAAIDLPLRDQQLVRVDRYLGFDWLQIMQIVDGWPRLLDLLDAAYATFTFQLIATVLILVLARRARDLDRFFITFISASMISEVASVVVPTLGPMSVLAGHSSFANLPTLGRTTAEIVTALRDGTLKEVDLDAINGIISFPSLHAAVAVIVPFALCWNKPLLCAVIALDSVMLVSAIPSGNHYLTDVVGGVSIAVLAIVCSRPIQVLLNGETSTQDC